MFEAFDPALTDSLFALMEEKNYTRAAKRLHITQPALTQRIQKLERILKEKIVQLGPSGIDLTDIGRRYLDEAKTIQFTLTQGIQQIRKSTGIRMAAEHEIISFFLLKPSQIFHQHWRLPLRLVTAIPKDAIIAVAAGDCDLAVVDRTELPDNLSFQEVGQIAYHLVLNQNHPLAHQPHLTMADLNGQDFVAFSPYCQHRSWFDSVMKKAGLKVSVRLESVLSEVLFSAVLSGWGLAFVPSFLPLPEGCLSREISDLPERKYFLVAQKSRMIQEEFHTMMTIITESFRYYNNK
ncbi:MAG: LysR family transcriptional regulator [Oligoflexus sp.]